jgi:hypothetical protein
MLMHYEPLSSCGRCLALRKPNIVAAQLLLTRPGDLQFLMFSSRRTQAGAHPATMLSGPSLFGYVMSTAEESISWGKVNTVVLHGFACGAFPCHVEET